MLNRRAIQFIYSIFLESAPKEQLKVAAFGFVNMKPVYRINSLALYHSHVA